MNKILDGMKNDLLSIPGRVRGAVEGMEVKKLFLSGAPYLIFGYVSTKISWQYRHEDRENFFQNLLYTLNDLGGSFHNPLPSLHPADLLAGICGGTAFFWSCTVRGRTPKSSATGRSTALQAGER